jgi:ferredoxin
VLRRIAIVGSGPAAWAAFKTLDSLHKNCCEIVILDAGFRESRSSQIPTLAGKTKFGSSHMYAGDFSNIRFQAASNFSLANGGLSTIWGAGIRLWDKEILLNYGDTDKIYKSAQELLTNIPYSGTSETLNFAERFRIKGTPSPPNSRDFGSLFRSENSEVSSYETALALDVSTSLKCVGCGNCLSGCPYGSIFDSGNAFDKGVAGLKIQRRQILVERITPTESGVKISGTGTNASELVEIFDEVHLCAGAIGTPALLLNSNVLDEVDLTVLDSQVFYFLGFRRFGKSIVPSFALSQITLSSRNSHNLDFKASLYRSNAEIRSRIKELLKSKLFFTLPVPRLLDRFLFLGIGFLDSKNSGLIELSKVENEVLVKPIVSEAKQIRIALSRIRKYLSPKGFHVVPGVFIKPLSGLGFHSGGGLPIGSIHVDEFGRLRKDSRIRISDVSILKSIPAGAHTFTAMAIVSSTIKSEYENSNHGA